MTEVSMVGKCEWSGMVLSSAYDDGGGTDAVPEPLNASLDPYSSVAKRDAQGVSRAAWQFASP